MTRGAALCFCFGLSALMAVSACAETITWTGTTSTNWGYTNNWNLGRIPAPGDDVVIDGGVKQPTLSLTVSPSIGSLVIGAGNASTLTLENASTDSRWLIVAGNLTVGPTGVVTHPAPPNNTETEYHRVNIQVQGNLAVQSGGRVDVDAKGYLAAKGPGKGGNNDAGSHGGLGYAYNGIVPITKTYGDWLTPTNWGSGGTSGSGGGGIRLDVGGSATIEGTLTAKGGLASTGGAGGSIWLRAASLSGSGLIRVNGGDHNNTAGGGGGRIALYLTNGTSVGSVTFTAYGGVFTNVAVKSKAGAAGTIYIEGKDDLSGRGQLIIDNDNRNAGEPVTIRLPAGSWSVYNLALRNRGVLDVWTNASLAIYTNPVSTGGEVTNQGLRMAGGSLSIQGIDLMVSNWSFIIDGPGTVSLTGNVTVATNGAILHSINGTGDAYRVDLAIDGNLTIQPGGRVDADARGFKIGSFGPGRGTSNDGGGHGGFGGSYGGSLSSFTYGSILNPVRSGSSSSYGAGGGAIKLTVTGVTTVDGWITAKGGGIVLSGSGGAGGSIWLTSGSLAGSGFIRADGGDFNNTAGGGGGRIALVLTNAVTFGSVTVTAAGGRRIPGSTAQSAGAAGTVYKQMMGQSPGEGSLTLDNLGSTSAVRCTTLISSSTTDRVVGNVLWQNMARFELATNQTLEVTGSWTNGSTNVFTANPGSTVIFSGTNTAAIYGSNMFYSLTCTNANKNLLFEAGRMTIVKPGGTFTMRGKSGGQWLGLHSTAPGAAWYLTLQSGSFQDVAYVSVRDSNANGGETVTAPTGNDEGANVKWEFSSGGLVLWTGAADTNWGNTNNWSTLKVPTQFDTVVIPDTANDPALDAARELAGLTNQAGAVLSLNGQNLIVNGPLVSAGTIVASAQEVLTVKGDVNFAGGAFTPANSTMRFEGVSPQSFTPSGNAFADLVVVNPALTVENGFIARDILVGSATNGLVFKGALTARDIWIPDTGSVVRFEAGAAARGLYCTAPAARLTFADATDYVFTNLQIRGTALAPVAISNSPGVSAWRLCAAQWSGVRYVNVKNSDAQSPGGPRVYAPDSVDAGGNLNWDFSTWHAWSGGVSSNVAAAANWTNGAVPGPGAYVLVDGDYATAPSIDAATNFARLSVGIGRASVLTMNAPVTVSEDCLVGPGGVLQHAANVDAETYRLTLNVGRDLIVATNGAIDVTGRGYLQNLGPGKAVGINDGGGHGGLGADWNGGPSSMTYGSIVTPTNAGSGGGQAGSGGGIIRLNVAGRSLVDGAISAKGGYVVLATCGGAGGSVWLTTGTLEGTGLIQADGGDHINTAGGGGGRVAVYVTNSASLGSVDIRARGGRHPITYLYPGAAGTVYIHTLAHGDQPGTLIVDNRNQSTLASDVTLVSSQTLDRTVGTVLIRAGGRLALGTNQALEVRGSWTNDGVFSAATGSTLVMSGPATATVTGTNAFFNLTAEGPGKSLLFAPSGTNRVNGTLTLNRVTLNSTTPGTPWFLSLGPDGSQQVSRVAVQDANAADGQTIIAQKSSDDGNTVNWLIRRSDGALIMVR